MRTQSEPPGPSVYEDPQSVPSSPSSSSATTGISGGSSHKLQYKGAWCTPPRIFMDHQVIYLLCIILFYLCVWGGRFSSFHNQALISGSRESFTFGATFPLDFTLSPPITSLWQNLFSSSMWLVINFFNYDAVSWGFWCLIKSRSIY